MRTCRLALVLVAAVAAGCGGGDAEDATPREPVPEAPAQPYVAALRAGYAPFRAAFVAAADACTTRPAKRRCRDQNARLSGAGKRLLEKLKRVPAPPRLQAADVQLKRGVRSIVEFADTQVACFDEGEADCAALDGDEYRVAEEDLSNSVREINARVRTANLPAPKE